MNSSGDEDMPQPIFSYGDGRSDDLVPGDYLKTIVNTFKETLATSFKVQLLENGLATNSVAEQWFDNLPAPTILDWDLVEAAFKIRWPKEVLVAETTENRRWKLRGEKLVKEDIGSTVMANGVEMSGQARWAGKIQTLSAQADDPSGALIHSVWNEMPQLMKKLVKSTYPTWPEFTQAVKTLVRRTSTLQWWKKGGSWRSSGMQRHFEHRLLNNPRLHPFALALAGLVSTVRGAPVMLVLQIQTSLKVAQWAATISCEDSKLPPEDRGGFPRGGPHTYHAHHLCHADLSANTVNMLHHPNTPQGLAAYALQVTAWKAANPTKYNGGDEFAPYPLTPGVIP